MLYKQNMVTHRRWKMQEKAINRQLYRGYYWKRGKGWMKYNDFWDEYFKEIREET